MFSAQHPEISDVLYALLKDYMNQTESLVFYGSRARGAGDELSDWDFLIITSTKAKDQMLARLASIRNKNPLFTPEILDLEGFKTCLRKALVFLKVVNREGKIIFDSGPMGLVRAAPLKPINVAHELLDAKKNILMGIALLKGGKPALACYRVVRGVRFTLLADLATRGIFSGEDIEREFTREFREFMELMEAYRMIKAGKDVRVDAHKLGKLIDRAILTWEKTRRKAGEMVGKEK
jgi:predicted nucleotidyltransferase